MIGSPDAAQYWWRDLQPDPAQGRPGDRGALARLRRCATVAEAMQEPATIALFRRVRASGATDLEVVALTAAVLAHVRDDVPGTVARLIGPDRLEEPETATLKPLRFRRLIEADESYERLIAFRRLVALSGGTLPVSDLAKALLDWSQNRRRRWIYDYWNAGAPTDQAAERAPAPETSAKDTAA